MVNNLPDTPGISFIRYHDDSGTSFDRFMISNNNIAESIFINTTPDDVTAEELMGMKNITGDTTGDVIFTELKQEGFDLVADGYDFYGVTDEESYIFLLEGFNESSEEFYESLGGFNESLGGFNESSEGFNESSVASSYYSKTNKDGSVEYIKFVIDDNGNKKIVHSISDSDGKMTTKVYDR